MAMAAAKLGLGTRLGLGFGLILVLLAVVAYFGISRLAAINTALDDIVHNKNPKVELANEPFMSLQLTQDHESIGGTGFPACASTTFRADAGPDKHHCQSRS
jgi:hypothetical protein